MSGFEQKVGEESAEARKAALFDWVALQTGIRSGERYVLEKMVALVQPVPGEPIRCNPRAKTIAARTNLHERNVRAIWERLVDHKLVTETWRHGHASEWVFNLGVVVAKQPKAKAAPRMKRPHLAAATPDESAAPESGRIIRPTPDESAAPSGRIIRTGADETPDKGSEEVVGGSSSRQYPPADIHTPGVEGERRTARRTATDYRIPCRDDLRGPDGKIRERRPGWYAVSESHVALFQRDYAALENAVGVKGTLLEAQKHYAGLLAKGVDSDDYLQIPMRGALMPRLRNVWLTRDQRRAMGGGKQEALPTGTEG